MSPHWLGCVEGVGGSRIVVGGGWAGVGAREGAEPREIGGGWGAARPAAQAADAARPSGTAGLIEVELGDGLGLGGIERGRLVEVVGGGGIHRGDGISTGPSGRAARHQLTPFLLFVDDRGESARSAD